MRRLFVRRENSSWSLSGGATPPPDPPGWRLRRERPHLGGYLPPDTPQKRLWPSRGGGSGGR
eukprot:1468916-Alexandrium_andersonii.AAC.1